MSDESTFAPRVAALPVETEDAEGAAAGGVVTDARPSVLSRFVGGPLNATDLAACILRLVLGLTLFVQGASKVVSWSLFGHTSSTREFADGFITFAGYDHAWFLSCLLTATEIIGGLLLILGLLTPLGAAAYIGIMFQFVSLQWSDGMFGHGDLPGYFAQLEAIAAASTIALIGPGHLAVDRALGFKIWGLRWGAYAIAFGILVGILVVAIFGPGLFSAPPPPPSF
jgi:putative oxidoreductase